MSQTLTLRPARADDEAFLYQLFYLAQVEKLALSHLEEAEKEKLINLIYSGFKRHYSLLAGASDDRIVLLETESVGRIILLQSRDEIRLADIALLPGHRNKGIGSALIGQIQAESIVSKRPVRLQVARFDRALRLYQRLGFYQIEAAGPFVYLEWRGTRSMKEEGRMKK
jgi:ribosomal protein S18 acetylase RimI-like enzyme